MNKKWVNPKFTGYIKLHENFKTLVELQAKDLKLKSEKLKEILEAKKRSKNNFKEETEAIKEELKMEMKTHVDMFKKEMLKTLNLSKEQMDALEKAANK